MRKMGMKADEQIVTRWMLVAAMATDIQLRHGSSSSELSLQTWVVRP